MSKVTKSETRRAKIQTQVISSKSHVFYTVSHCLGRVGAGLNHSQRPLNGAVYFLKPLPTPQKTRRKTVTITSYIVLSKMTHFVLVRVH